MRSHTFAVLFTAATRLHPQDDDLAAARVVHTFTLGTPSLGQARKMVADDFKAGKYDWLGSGRLRVAAIHVEPFTLKR